MTSTERDGVPLFLLHRVMQPLLLVSNECVFFLPAAPRQERLFPSLGSV